MSNDNKIIYSMIKVGKFYDQKPVLKDISLFYFHGAKIGVLGLNGAGKSTLLRIMAGVERNFNGETVLAPGYSIGDLEQEPLVDVDKAVREVVEEGAQQTVDLLKEFEAINNQFAEPMSDAEMDQLIQRQGEVQEKLDALNAWDLDSRLDMAMDALRCPPAETPVAVLSGGEKRRVALCRLFRLHLKQRFYGIGEGRRYKRIDHTDQLIEVRERDLKFYVNPWDYVDIGLFSDHRDTRRMVGQMAAGKDFLNLFCYTGSFTCYAAKCGARSTVSVDRSRSAIDWTRKNMALNGLAGPHHQLVQRHANDYLARVKREHRQFDLAVVDPPSFYTIRSREDRFDIAAEHPALLRAVMEVMRRGGTIVFSTNHQAFDPLMDELDVQRVEEITARTIPEDYRSKRKTIHRCWMITV